MVTDQVPPLVGHDPIAGDVALVEAGLVAGMGMTEKHGGSECAPAPPAPSSGWTGHSWEGSGNVIALDVLRALDRDSAATTVLAEISAAARVDARLDTAVTRLEAELADPAELAVRARRIAGLIALCLQGSLLLQHAPAAVADAFCASRRGGDWGPVAGTLPTGTAITEIVDRAVVAPA